MSNMAESPAPALALKGVTRVFQQAEQSLSVLQGIDLLLKGGEMTALVGPSGSGKSTLLQIAGLLEPPTAGEVRVMNEVTSQMTDQRLTFMRRRHIGFVYQYHHLMAEFSALENVVIPQLIARSDRRSAEMRAIALLQSVGLGNRLHHRPARLSGGEQQRVAIARALANQPAVLLADEPTGNLDPHTAEEVFERLQGLVHEHGIAALIATHNLSLAERMDRILSLQNGRISEGPALPERRHRG